MKKYRKNLLMLSVLMIFFIAACASKPVLRLNYQLPDETGELKKQKVAVSVVDERGTTTILSGKNAKSKLPEFTGYFSLAIVLKDYKGPAEGIYLLPNLFKEAFKKRLIHAGAMIAKTESEADIMFRIVLKKFDINLETTKWKTSIAYDVKVMKNGKLLATQSVSSEGQRVQVMGTSGADKVTSEIFTDLANNINIAKLVEKAVTK